MAPVVGDHRPGLAQLQRKVVQGGQQVGPLLLVPENQAFGLPDLLVALQGLGVLGPQLGDGVVQKPPALRRPGPDQVKVLRAEQHRVQGLPQLRGLFQLHPVPGDLPPGVVAEGDFHGKIPAPAGYLSGEEAVLDPEENQFLVIPGPVALGTGQIGDGLQQVGLALGVVPGDDVHARVELNGGGQVVAEILQFQPFDGHSMVTVTPSMVTLSPLRSFLPRMVHTSPLTSTSPS